jgi:hypothetical protein
MTALFRDDDLAFRDGEIYFTEADTDIELMYVALGEVGLTPDENGGGWLGWDRELTQEGYDLVVKAEQLIKGRSA